MEKYSNANATMHIGCYLSARATKKAFQKTVLSDPVPVKSGRHQCDISEYISILYI